MSLSYRPMSSSAAAPCTSAGGDTAPGPRSAEAANPTSRPDGRPCWPRVSPVGRRGPTPASVQSVDSVVGRNDQQAAGATRREASALLDAGSDEVRELPSSPMSSSLRRARLRLSQNNNATRPPTEPPNHLLSAASSTILPRGLSRDTARHNGVPHGVRHVHLSPRESVVPCPSDFDIYDQDWTTLVQGRADSLSLGDVAGLVSSPRAASVSLPAAAGRGEQLRPLTPSCASIDVSINEIVRLQAALPAVATPTPNVVASHTPPATLPTLSHGPAVVVPFSSCSARGGSPVLQRNRARTSSTRATQASGASDGVAPWYSGSPKASTMAPAFASAPALKTRAAPLQPAWAPPRPPSSSCCMAGIQAILGPILAVGKAQG